jgi:hypothetical protein
VELNVAFFYSGLRVSPDVVFVRIQFRALVVEFQIDGGTAPSLHLFRHAVLDRL